MWSHASCRRVDGSGYKHPCSHWSLGNLTSPIHAVRTGRPRWYRPWQRCAPRLTRTRSRNGSPPTSLQTGTRGQPSGSTSFSVGRRLSKGATAIGHKCTTISEGYPSGAIRCGPVLHNFDCRAADGTTPAARFFGQSLPDLFETVLSYIDDLPRPRKRNQAMALPG